MTLRELRKNKGITQREAADFLEIPLRTYSNYENDPKKQVGIKYNYMIEKLRSYGYTDEENGILSLEEIKKTCSSIFPIYRVEYCYLFGSYAKGKATPTSDVDLLICSEATGLRFFELIEKLREGLKKKVDVLDQSQLTQNPELINEILRDGIKIYG